MHQMYQHQICFVPDKIHKGYILVQLWPTDETTGDFLTRPNQEYILKIFIELIIGVMPPKDPSNEKQGNRKEEKN